MTYEELKKAMAKYCKNEASYSYLKDCVTDYIENHTKKDQTYKVKMICEDCFSVRCFLESGDLRNGIEKFKFIKGYIKNLK